MRKVLILHSENWLVYILTTLVHQGQHFRFENICLFNFIFSTYPWGGGGSSSNWSFQAFHFSGKVDACVEFQG